LLNAIFGFFFFGDSFHSLENLVVIVFNFHLVSFGCRGIRDSQVTSLCLWCKGSTAVALCSF
jgi:hypothetical protein